jgi:hypothetical protein
MNALRLGYPKILLFCSDRHDSTEQGLFYALHNLPAKVIVVSPRGVPNAIESLSSRAVVACVFVVSPRAFADSSFGQSLQECVKVLSVRREFRLFVHLSGISRQQLMDLAQSVPAAADLLDSANIGESSEQDQAYTLVRNIEMHLRQLPEILNYLGYDRWKRVAVGLTALLNVAFMVVLALGWWRLAVHPQETLEGPHLGWILATIGAVFYSSFLVVCSFGSTLRTGTLLRWVMAFFPLWIISSIPSSKILANWPFLVAGFGVGILLDASRRMWAQSRREQIPISPPIEDRALSVAVGRYWQMLTTAPVLGTEPNVFISYSRSSPWGSSTASALHENLKRSGTSSFLDVENIAEGTSWRHKIQQAIGRATVFISVQDSITARRYWPRAELNAALQSQRYCGLPTIIILRDATLVNGTREGDQTSPLDALLSQKGEVDPTLLRIIDFKSDTPNHLARGLSDFSPASVVNPSLSVIFGYALGPLKVALAALGAIGAGVSIIASIAWVVCQFSGIKVEELLNAWEVNVPVMLLAAFWVGFVIRLVFASRFELLIPTAHLVFWSHLWAVFALIGMLRIIVPTQTPLSIVFAIIIGGFGFLSACDFVSKSLPDSGNYRPPPI